MACRCFHRLTLTDGFNASADDSEASAATKLNHD